MIISVNKNLMRESIIAYCSKCRMGTLHTLSKAGDYYACGCGEKIDVEVTDETE